MLGSESTLLIGFVIFTLIATLIVISSRKKGSYSSQDIEFNITELKTKIEATKVNHILHLILSIMTGGIWIIVWILITIDTNNEKRVYINRLKKEYKKKENLIKKENNMNGDEIKNDNKMDNTEKLIKLAELKEKGLITHDEFTAQKSKLI